MLRDLAALSQDNHATFATAVVVLNGYSPPSPPLSVDRVASFSFARVGRTRRIQRVISWRVCARVNLRTTGATCVFPHRKCEIRTQLAGNWRPFNDRAKTSAQRVRGREAGPPAWPFVKQIPPIESKRSGTKDNTASGRAHVLTACTKQHGWRPSVCASSSMTTRRPPPSRMVMTTCVCVCVCDD